MSTIIAAGVMILIMLCRGTAVGKENIQGEDQKKLDVIANELFINMLKSSFEVGTQIVPSRLSILYVTCCRSALWCPRRMRNVLKFQLLRGGNM